MSTPLRVGFLVSGILHVAVVAAFSLSPPQSVPAVDAALPITLRLAAFQPPPAVPVVPVIPEPVRPAPASEAPPPEPLVKQIQTTPPVEPQPVAPAQAVVAEPPKPRRVPKPVAASRPEPAKVPATRPAPVARPASALSVARVASPEPAVPVVDVQVTRHYLAALAARINHSKFYPRASRRLGEEGMVVVSFVIQRNGELTDLNVIESSGHRRLDEAALKTLQRVSPFDKIPDAIDREQWPISVPIAFSLRG